MSILIKEEQKWIHKVTKQKVIITYYNDDDVYGYFVKGQIWIHRKENYSVKLTQVTRNDVYFETRNGERSEQKEAFEEEFKKPPNVAFKNIQRNENDQEYEELKVDFVRMYKLDEWDTTFGEISFFELGNEAHQELQKSRGKFWDILSNTWEDKFVDYIGDIYDLSAGDLHEDDNNTGVTVYILKIDVEAQTVFVVPATSPNLIIIEIDKFMDNYTFYSSHILDMPEYVVLVRTLLTLDKLNTLHDIQRGSEGDAVVINYNTDEVIDNITFPEEPEPFSQFVESYERFDAGDQWISINYEVCILKIDTENKLVLFVNIQKMNGIVYDMRDVQIQPIATFYEEYAKTAEDREWLSLRPDQAYELVNNWIDTEKFADGYQDLKAGEIWNANKVDEDGSVSSSDNYVLILKINTENNTVFITNIDEVYIIGIMEIEDFKKQFAQTMTKGDYRKLSVSELILLDNFWKERGDVEMITVDLRTVMFGKMFTVEQFRKNPLIDDDYALTIKYLDEELDCDIGISIGTRKNPVKIKVGDDWDRDKDGFLTIFCAKDLKKWLNTNTGSYGLNANTADQYFENRELHDNNPSKPWQTIVGIQYLTQEEIDEEEKKYNDRKEKDETNELLESIIKKKREVEILKKELTYLRWNYAISQFEERAELLKSKMQRIQAKIRMLKIQIQQQQNILKWTSESNTDNETKLKF